MKKSIWFLLFSVIVAPGLKAQLSDLEKNTLVESWGLDSKFSSFSGDAKDKILNDPANSTNLKTCANTARKHKILDDALKWQITDFDKMYEKIAANYDPEFTNRIFSRFNKKDFMSSKTMATKIQKGVGGDNWYNEPGNPDEYASAFIAAYIKKRNENFTKENAFSVLELTDAERIKEMMPSADKIKSANLSGPQLVMEMLEFNYWKFKYKHVHKLLGEEKEELDKSVIYCNELAFKLLQKAAGGDFDYSVLLGRWDRHSGGPSNMSIMQLTFKDGVVSGGWNQGAKAISRVTSGNYNIVTRRLTLSFIREWDKITGKANFEFRENSANYILEGGWRFDDGSASGSWTMLKSKE